MAPLRTLALAGSAGLACSLLSALPSHAHGLAEAGFSAGLIHPLAGLDHLLLLIGVGAAATLERRLLGAALLGALVGAGLGALGAALPAAETLAALSLPVLAGLLMLLQGSPGAAAGLRLPLAGGLVAAAMAIHALLHAQEAGDHPLWWIGAALSALLTVGLSRMLLQRAGRGLIPALALLLGLSGLALAVLPLG